MCSLFEEKFEHLSVRWASENVLQVELNRPERRNALNMVLWAEIGRCFEKISKNGDVRAVVLTGAGPVFCSGIDLSSFSSQELPEDYGRRFLQTRSRVMALQDCFTAIARCPQPVIVAVHSACVGAAIDLLTSTDIRLCSTDAWFAIKEIELGLPPDTGTLQRLPKIIGNDSLMRELTFTGRRFEADEALRFGLVSQVCEGGREGVISRALELAKTLAARSPVAMVATKITLNYSRDHSVSDGLDYMSTWVGGVLYGQDMQQAVEGYLSKKTPTFSKL